MVQQVLAHLGDVPDRVDAVLGELFPIADAGQHQQLRGVDGAAAQHHLAAGVATCRRPSRSYSTPTARPSSITTRVAVASVSTAGWVCATPA